MLKIKSIWVMVLLSGISCAQMDQFHAGDLIKGYGSIADAPGMEAVSPDTKFKISFDVSKQAKAGEINRSLDSGARFLNMHVKAGLKPENIQLAFVIHGKAVRDLTQEKFYQDVIGTDISNKNVGLINALQANGVQFYVCGQSAAYYGVKKEDLISGVKLSLSAMTAHAQLQQSGYTVNPF